MVVDNLFKLGLGNDESLRSYGSKSSVDFGKAFRDRALQEVCVLIDEIRKAAGVAGGINLSNDRPLDLIITNVKNCRFSQMKAMGFCDL